MREIVIDNNHPVYCDHDTMHYLAMRAISYEHQILIDRYL